VNGEIPVIFVTLFVLLCAAAVTQPLAILTRVPYPILLVLTGFLLHLSQEYLSLPLDVFTTKEIAHDLILFLFLPTLVFETAYNLDISKLNANRLAIFVLALPGVLISTLIVAAMIGWFTSLNWHLALLLGAILSATDPSAVISAFRQLGAPKDLIMLIEGESLFNDATAIMLTKILVVSFAATDRFWSMLGDGSGLFLLTLGGGALCGWLLAHLLILLQTHIADNPFLEISLSLLLAFTSYFIAEEVLHASGIIATTTAGITLAIKAPLPISHISQQYLNHFWSYLSYLATASIFLIVGLWMDWSLIWENIDIALLVLAALWLSRALIAYWLLPRIGYLQQQAKTTPVEFRHIVFIGGMRGAVTLALAMGLVSLTGDEVILSVTISVVFFSTLLQGMIIRPLVTYLAPTDRDINDQISRTELALLTLRHGKKALQPLLNSTFASTGAPQALTLKLIPMIEAQEKQLQHWFSVDVGPVGLWNRLMLRCASAEIGFLYHLFDQGLISSRVFEKLKNGLDEQMQAIRHQYKRPLFSLLPEQLPSLLQELKSKVKHRSTKQVELEYEMAWARVISCNKVLEDLQLWSEDKNIPEPVSKSVLQIWQGWRDNCEQKIALIDSQQPVIAAKVQRQLVINYLLTAQAEYLQTYVEQSLISEDDAQRINELLKTIEL